MAKPSLTTNRRDLLIGASAFAVTGGAVALPGSAPLSGMSPAMDVLVSPAREAPGPDPAHAAYVRATKAEGELRKCRRANGEDKQEFHALYRAFIDAELSLADTAATSLMGVSAKITRIAADQWWRHGDMCMGSRLGFSVLADLKRMIAATPPGWPGEAPNIGRRS